MSERVNDLFIIYDIWFLKHLCGMLNKIILTNIKRSGKVSVSPDVEEIKYVYFLYLIILIYLLFPVVKYLKVPQRENETKST